MGAFGAFEKCVTPKNMSSIPVSIEIETNTQPVQKQERDYLLHRLECAESRLSSNLRQSFSHPSQPETAQQLVDAIKNGEYEIDQKKIDRLKDEYEVDDVSEVLNDYGCFYAIKWTKFPGYDEKGWAKAREALHTAYQETKDIISVSDALTGLAALQAFQKWTYVPATA